MKVIKTEEEYRNALGEVKKLTAIDPVPGSPEADQLELYALLINEYESQNIDIPLPDPIEAIECVVE